ncbi:MAG: protein kinase [Verrucomicrobiales bacterium]|nr:protein kinase [Verrucomicrobiales bacterium]
MATPPPISCRGCGCLIVDAALPCPRCLLAAGGESDANSRTDALFARALALPPEDRLAFVHGATAEEPELRRILEAMLAAWTDEESDPVGDLADKEGAPDPATPSGVHSVTAEEAGDWVGPFQLLELLGEGGMGSVWKAQQSTPVRRTVALKLIKLGMDTREVVRRFERERQTLALLNHPNIAQVYEAGASQSGRPYFVMELVPGQPITAFCDAAALGLRERIRLFLEVCAAVEHAHQKGVIHRDLKPSNILVADGRVKVIDFGVAKATDVTEGTLLTRSCFVMGTPSYMSPEQALSGVANLDTRADVYALGVVLYELLTGSLPIESSRLSQSSLLEIQRILLEVEPPTPSVRCREHQRVEGTRAAPAVSWGPALRGELDWVVMTALRKDRERRYPSAAALAEDLRRYLDGEPVRAVPPTLSYQVGKFVRRNRLAVAFSLLMAAAMILGTVVSVRQAVRANRAQRVATLTLSDMYARSGLAAADGGDQARAALWFANAAVIAGADRPRVEANRVRTAAWSRNILRPVRALEIPVRDFDSLRWNPAHPALIVSASAGTGAWVWDLESDRLWKPEGLPPPGIAVWNAAGDRIAILSGTNLLVCDYPSGTERARQTVASVRSLAFSPDSRWLTVGSETAFLWEWETGDRRPLPGLTSASSVVRFSADGKRLLLQSETQVGICDLAAPSVFLHPPVPHAPGSQSDFLADGDRYVTAGPDEVTHIRETSSGEILESHPPNGFKPPGYPTGSSPDGRFIGRSNGPLLDRTPGPAANFPAHDNVMTAVCFAADSAWLASGGADNVAKLWELPGGRLIGEMGRHQSTVQRLAFSPDTTMVASAQDGLVRVWRLAVPPLLRTIQTERPSLAVLSRDTRFIAPSGWTLRGLESLDRTRVIDLQTGRAAGPDLVTGGIMMGAAFSPDGTWLAIITSTTPNRPQADLGRDAGSGNLQLWNPWNGERLGEPIPLPSEPRGVAIHPSGKWVGICGNGGRGLEVEVATRRVQVHFDQQHYSESEQTLNNGRCAYSPDGRIFVVYGSSPSAHLWDRERGAELVPLDQLEGMSFDVDFSGNTVAIALLGPRSRVDFRDLRTGLPVVPPMTYSGWPFLGRFSPEGRVFLTTGRNRVGEVWDWQTGQRLCPALRHDHEVMGGAFVPGHPWVVTGGHDGQIKFWDYRDGMAMAPPMHRGDWVLDLQVTRDGGTLVASRPMVKVIDLIDLAKALPEPDLAPEDARLLAEIEASAEVHPGGDWVPLSAEEWLVRWRAFRRHHPEYPGHRLPMKLDDARAWHAARASELELSNPGAASWHRQRAAE